MYEDQKSSLKGVLRLVHIVKPSASKAQDHGAMALDQGLEWQLGDFSPAGDE